jgi:hypothetical protein
MEPSKFPRGAATSASADETTTCFQWEGLSWTNRTISLQRRQNLNGAPRKWIQEPSFLTGCMKGILV